MAEKQVHHILLTGCAGFIGSHLTERLLAEGHQVIGIDNFDDFYSRRIKESNIARSGRHPSFRFLEIDIRNKKALDSINEDIDTVIHLAAKAGVIPSLKNVDDYISTNISGTNHILDLMKEREIKKLLFASSSSVYGNNNKIPFSENDPVNEPISPYAFTKRSAELMNYSYHHLYNLDILNLRLFTVYGPRQRPDLAIHKFIRLVDDEQPISMFGDGSTARDYTFVADTVQGFTKALKYIHDNTGVFEIVNLGNNNPVKLFDLISAIGNAMQKDPIINRMPMQPGDVHITYADIAKARSLFGYQPTTALEEGLNHFIKWYYEQEG